MPTNSPEYVEANREKIRAQHKAWVQNHRDKDHSSCKRWRDEHKKERLDYFHKWKAKNPSKEKTSRYSCQHTYRFNLVMKKGGKCELCGYDESFVALQFHHLNPEEKESTWIKEQDLDKLMLVCANCHKWIHSQRAEEFYDKLRKDCALA